MRVEKQQLLTELQVAHERTVGEGQETPIVAREEASTTQALPPSQQDSQAHAQL